MQKLRIMPTKLEPWTGMKEGHIYLTRFPEGHPDPLYCVDIIPGPEAEEMAEAFIRASNCLASLAKPEQGGAIDALNPERIRLYEALCREVREFIEEYNETKEGSEEWLSLVSCVCDGGDRLAGMQPTVCRVHGLARILDGISETPETMEQLAIQKEMERPATDQELEQLSSARASLKGVKP